MLESAHDERVQPIFLLRGGFQHGLVDASHSARVATPNPPQQIGQLVLGGAAKVSGLDLRLEAPS
jgi:hypothetical protein